MSTPQFVLDLRAHVGHDRLWLPGCTAVVLRMCGPLAGSPVPTDTPIDPSTVEVLVVRRSDNGAWTPITGIVDPGETPWQAAERETCEEADVQARTLRLLSQEVVGPMTYDNGDEAIYLDTCFLLEWIDGDPWPADGENTHARFVRADALPHMNERFTRCVARALDGQAQAELRN